MDVALPNPSHCSAWNSAVQQAFSADAGYSVAAMAMGHFAVREEETAEAVPFFSDEMVALTFRLSEAGLDGFYRRN